MSQVIRFKDLVLMLDFIDNIQIGTHILSDTEMNQLSITNPLVHIERIKHGEEYLCGITDITYYITIL